MITASDAFADQAIIDLSETAAGGFATRLLAQLGAVVTRLDLAAPDRPHSGEMADHEGKIVVPMPGEPARLRSMIERAGCVVTDLPIARLHQYGVHWETFDLSGSGVIYTRVSGFGNAGPLSVLPTDELLVDAFSGLSSMIGFPDREPLALPSSIGLREGGLHAAAASATAMLHRAATGNGALIDIAVVDVLAAVARNYAHVIRYYDVPVKRAGRRAPGSAGRYPLSLFACKDGYVVVTVRTSAEWAGFLSMIGDPPWADLERYRDERAIAVEYPDEVDEFVAPWMVAHTRAEILALGQVHGVVLGAVRTIPEVLQDAQFEHRGFFASSDIVVAGDRTAVLPSFPAIFGSAPGTGHTP